MRKIELIHSYSHIHVFFFIVYYSNFSQALAAAYAYNQNYREYMGKLNSPLYEISIDLAKK